MPGLQTARRFDPLLVDLVVAALNIYHDQLANVRRRLHPGTEPFVELPGPLAYIGVECLGGFHGCHCSTSDEPPVSIACFRALLASLTVSPAAVRGGRSPTGKVSITGPAPSGGVAVTLASSNAAASVPSSVTVPAGATEATFQITTARVRRNTRVTLTATLGAVQKTATLTVRK